MKPDLYEDGTPIPDDVARRKYVPHACTGDIPGMDPDDEEEDVPRMSGAYGLGRQSCLPSINFTKHRES